MLIIKVIPKEDYHLEILLDNGSSIILNLANKLQTLRFGMLADSEFFKRVETDGTCISWGSRLEISLSEVIHLIQK